MAMELTRRHFLGTAASTTVLGSRAALGSLVRPNAGSRRRFYLILSLARLGFHASFAESVDLAVKHSFEGIDPDPEYFASLGGDGLKRLLDDLRTKNLRFGAAGLPVEFRESESTLSE